MMRVRWFIVVLLLFVAVGFSAIVAASPALAAEKAPPAQVLFKNVNIFDGIKDTLHEGQDVLVEGNLIKKIGKDLKADDKATVINGGGRTLMPGPLERFLNPPGLLLMISAHFSTAFL